MLNGFSCLFKQVYRDILNKKYRFQFFVSFIKQNDCQTSHPERKGAELQCTAYCSTTEELTGFQPLVVKQQDELQCEFKRP